MHSYQAWLSKAQSDLKSARALLGQHDDHILDAAVYHTQQCAEKAFKAFLAYKQCPILKTHDLERLVELCVQIDSSFETLLLMAAHLNPYDTQFRYPDDILLPERDEVEQAIGTAEQILLFVQKKITTSY